MKKIIVFTCTLLLVHSAQAQAPINVDGRFNTDVHFEHTSTTPSSTQLQRLTDDVNKVRKSAACPLEKVIAVGHADMGEGNQQVTQELSMKRVLYIEQFLIDEGIPATHIIIDNRGATEPVANPPDQRNARVELEFIVSAYPGAPCTIPVGPRGFRLANPIEPQAGDMRAKPDFQM
jgi:outer membrane protein OmpA-like peptidoglycan-associated protein